MTYGEPRCQSGYARGIAVFTDLQVPTPAAWLDFSARVQSLLDSGRRGAALVLLWASVVEIFHVGSPSGVTPSFADSGFRFPWLGTGYAGLSKPVQRDAYHARPSEVRTSGAAHGSERVRAWREPARVGCPRAGQAELIQAPCVLRSVLESTEIDEPFIPPYCLLCCCPTWSVCSKAAGSMPGWGPERVEEQRARQLRDQYGLQLGDDLAYAFVSPSRTQCALVANPLQSNGWKQGPTPDQSLLHDAANTGSSSDRRPLSRRAKG